MQQEYKVLRGGLIDGSDYVAAFTELITACKYARRESRKLDRFNNRKNYSVILRVCNGVNDEDDTFIVTYSNGIELGRKL